MLRALESSAARLKVLLVRLLTRFGMGDDGVVVLLALIVGTVTGAAAVGFHQLLVAITDLMYQRAGPDLLYGRGIFLLVLIPASGGLAVGLVSRYVFKTREGHGVVDVIESVAKASGFQRPATAIEKIITSAFTIGTGGSAGAEGPIVQIGAAIASGVGQFFRLARPHMPTLIGCGGAAGISAIFNAPFGGVLFALEVILQDFSPRTITPVVVSSVVAQVTTLALFQLLDRLHGSVNIFAYKAIFAMPSWAVERQDIFSWAQFPNFVVLGLICGLVGLALTITMQRTESLFGKMRLPRPLRPAVGGAVLGAIGVIYVVVFGRVLYSLPKPFHFDVYPMPAFFGDGYGVIQRMLTQDFYADPSIHRLLLLLVSLCVIKVIATSMTLSSGGSGGIIAPSLFLGATAGGVLGILLRASGYFPNLQPELYALVGMGAVLTAAVHAPMASILIVFELTQDHKVMVPAMLACVTATGIAKIISPDSIYTAALRRRGVRIGIGSDLRILRRLSVEQVPLEPAAVLHLSDPFQRVLDLMDAMHTSHFVVVNGQGLYAGMVVEREINTALLQRDAVPLMIVSELLRSDIPTVRSTDDLAAVLEVFARFDVAQLPVCLATTPGKVIGLISRAGLMRRYQAGLGE